MIMIIITVIMIINNINDNLHLSVLNAVKAVHACKLTKGRQARVITPG